MAVQYKALTLQHRGNQKWVWQQDWREKGGRGREGAQTHPGYAVEKNPDMEISNHCQEPEAEEKLLLGTLTLAYLHTF